MSLHTARRWLQSLFVVILIAATLWPQPVVMAGPLLRQLNVGQQQIEENPAAVYNPFVALFPELKRLPAPSWLREGSRTTYYVQSATIVQDPDADGSGGAGYSQYDLVALDRRNAVASATFYLDAGDGVVSPSFTTAMIALPAAGDYWLNPTVLVDAERVANDDLVVLHMPTTIGGEQYDAVRFEYTSAAGVYVWMFDEVSGILLFYRHTLGEADGQRQLADMTLVNNRRVRLPWNAASAPAWLERGQQMHFEGSYTAYIPGVNPTPLPYSADATIDRVQTRWSGYTLTDSTAGVAGSGMGRVCGVAQIFDALWLPDEALNAQVRRPLIDRDPVTGAEVSYQRSGRTVTLSEAGSSYESTLVYDQRNGGLLAIRQQRQVGIATIVVELQLVQ